MNRDIQPQIYTDTIVSCACGNSFVTTSTQKSISIEICGACHPFYTGQQKFVDTEGRIDKFKKKQQIAKAKKKTADEIKKAKLAKGNKVKTRKQSTLKDMLEQARKSE